MYEWKIRIDVWPHSTGQGASVDQGACGPRTQIFNVIAGDIREAIGVAQMIVKGIKTNPRVWEAPIFEVSRICEAGYIKGTPP